MVNPKSSRLVLPGDPEFSVKDAINTVNRLHDYDDLDNGPDSHHHTLGRAPYQAAPGNHDTYHDELMFVRNETFRRHYFSSTETYGAAWTIVPSIPAFTFTKVKDSTGLEMEMGGTGYLNTGLGLLHFGIRVTPPGVAAANHEIGRYFFNVASDHRQFWGERREVASGFGHAVPKGVWNIQAIFLQDSNLFTVDLNDSLYIKIKEKAS